MSTANPMDFSNTSPRHPRSAGQVYEIQPRANMAVYPYEETVRTLVSESTLRNRQNALKLNFGYIIFLLAAAVATISICVSFLRTRAQYTALREETTYLETQLDALRLENDATENDIYLAVDLEYVKEVAETKLGMVPVSQTQITTYSSSRDDYVKQYQDIPRK